MSFIDLFIGILSVLTVLSILIKVKKKKFDHLSPDFMLLVSLMFAVIDSSVPTSYRAAAIYTAGPISVLIFLMLSGVHYRRHETFGFWLNLIVAGSIIIMLLLGVVGVLPTD